MKDTFYFSHDYNVRSDEKIKLLIRKHGMVGYGCFWAIIEDLYNNANAMRTDYDGIAFELRVESKLINCILNDFDLFVFEGENFGSLSIQKRIDQRNKKSLKAKESANYRWNKDANAMQSQCERIENLCERNAIKERKGKDKKEIKEINIPPFEEFKDYAISKKDNIDLLDLKLKYDSWIENEWKTGKGTKITNWKSTLLNTIPYLKETIKQPIKKIINADFTR